MRLLITGGAGFLGRAIVRTLDRQDLWGERGVDPPELITIYSRDEAKQWAMGSRFADPRIRYVLGDINDTARLQAAMAGHDAVIHAAAIKFIPEAERNVREAIKVNVQGSLSVLDAATQARVEILIGISTDKACAPLNVYGMTKAIMERAFQAGRPEGRTVTARYGNVIGSTGSVVPVFMAQLAKNYAISVTDPEMTRFWLTGTDAVRILVHALADTRDRIIYVPKAKSLTMAEVAEAVLTVAGRPIDWGRMPVRPGEKKHEDLIIPEESFRTHGTLDPEISSGDYLYIAEPTGLTPYTDEWRFSSAYAQKMDLKRFEGEVRHLIEVGELPG
jgi:FlaA1/EpsC-like NDP-sugar epimerase